MEAFPLLQGRRAASPALRDEPNGPVFPRCFGRVTAM